MLVSKKWLQDYIEETLPATDALVEKLSMHAFEIEGVDEVKGDEVIDVDVLPNRSHDCLGHFGVAKEVCTLFDLTFKAPVIEYPKDESLQTKEYLTLTVENAHLVPRATKRLVTNVKIGESPDWLKEKLETLGQRSINNVVDITNFVMLETGQPVHAFDYDKLAGEGVKNVSIRGAKQEEKVLTLDGNEYELEEGMLVIADDEKALDIAGIKGGSVSGIDENTTRVMLSICNFNSSSIRKTSQKLGLVTDASKRFGNGLTPEWPGLAMERLSQLIHEIAGGNVAEDFIDEYPRVKKSYLLGVSTQEANRLLGAKLTDTDVEDILRRLRFAYKKIKPIDTVLETAKTLEGKVYKYGASLSYDAPDAFDCSSFINYLFTQAGVGVPRMTVDHFVFGDEVAQKDLQPGDVVFSRNNRGPEQPEYERVADGTKTTNEAIKKISKDFLPGTDVSEGVSHNGVYLGEGKVIHASAKWHKGHVVIEDLKESVAFQNIVGFRRMLPSNDERYVVTIPSERLDLQATRGYLVSGNTQDLIEEIGRVYGYNNIDAIELSKNLKSEVSKQFYYAEKIRDVLVNEGFSEVFNYSFGVKGDVELANPLAKDRPILRNSLQEGLMKTLEEGMYYKDLLGEDVIRVFEIGTVFTDKGEYVELGIGMAGMKQGKIENVLHEVQGVLSEALGVQIKEKVSNGIVTINFTNLIEKLPEPESYDDIKDIDTSDVVYKALSPYPFILRDIAVWTPETISSDDVLKIIHTHAGSLLVNDTLFDTYAKDGKVSYAFHLVFQSYEKTLSDDEVNPIMEKITEALNAGEEWDVR